MDLPTVCGKSLIHFKNLGGPSYKIGLKTAHYSPPIAESIYNSLNNGPVLKGSITWYSCVGGSASWFQCVMPCLSQCAYVPGTLSEPSLALHSEPQRRPEHLKDDPVG